MAITLHELARELKLDHSTVAYALSGKGTIKQATRQRVREVADKLGYVVNGPARRMRAQKTGCIGLAVGRLTPGNAELLWQIVNAAQERGYGAEIAVSAVGPDRLEQAIRGLLESRVDGIVLIDSPRKWSDVPGGHAMRHAVSQRVPIVCLGQMIAGGPISAFEYPMGRQAQMLTESLLQTGRRRFTWLMPVAPPFGPEYVSRIEGTALALRAAGLSSRDLRIVSTNSADGNLSLMMLGQKLFRRAMSAGNGPMAILCPDDQIALGAISVAQGMGLRIGPDVAIAATGRGAAAELSPISLSTCDIPPAAAAAGVVELLLRCLRRQPDHPVTVTGEPKLMLGQSTAN